MAADTQDDHVDEVLYTVRLVDGETFGPASREQIVQWARESRIPNDAMIEDSSGPVMRADALDWIVEAGKRTVPPRTPEGLRSGEKPPNAMDHVIPLRNAPALFSWYLGVFSLIPFLGIPLGIAAIVLGIIGLLKVGQGSAKVGFWHAVLGIGFGVIGTFAFPLLLMLL